MKKDDVQLIRITLSGDDAAFSTLVQKYRKSVHALAWRKIGDFHYAEEITQDTFLQAYKKTLNTQGIEAGMACPRTHPNLSDSMFPICDGRTRKHWNCQLHEFC